MLPLSACTPGNEPSSSPDSAAHDVITAFGEAEIRTVEDLLSALRKTESGESVPLVILRDGQRQEQAVTIESR
ncbi:PDZ domain-containing protein [Amycolatopsis lurida]